jgi:hypothetical protein
MLSVDKAAYISSEDSLSAFPQRLQAFKGQRFHLQQNRLVCQQAFFIAMVCLT